MKVDICTTLLVFIVVGIESAADFGILNQKEEDMNNGHDVTKLRVRRVTKPVSLDKDNVRKHKHRKIEIIPADESLKRDQFVEEVEDQLGSTSIGKYPGNKRLRRDRNKRACIYIDIPGSHPDDEVDIIIPGALARSASVENENSLTVEGLGEPTAGRLQSLETIQTASSDVQQLQTNDEQKILNTGSDDLGAIYWLKLPPSATVRSREMLMKLYQVVHDFHQSGKDVLFVPISKGYLNTDEAKNGFLRALQVNPVERERNLKTLEIKQM